MNIQQLEYIIAVEQLRNFSRAAESCNITQATLSTMIKKMEQELDITIFDRKVSPVIVTDCGQEIVDEAKKVLYHIHQLKELAKNTKHIIEGTVRIGVIPTIANALLPLILKPILTKFPNLEIEIVEITSDHIIQHLKSGKLDAGILSTPLQLSEIEENILFYETLMVYGLASGNPQPLTFEAIDGEQIWLLEETHCLTEQIVQLCALEKQHQVSKNLKFRANSFETLLNMVDTLGGITFIPELYFHTLAEDKKSKVRIFQLPIPVREVSLVYFRPFAKHRIIDALTTEIQALVSPHLISNTYKTKDLIIIQI